MERSKLFGDATWRKATGSSDGNCVEVAMSGQVVGVRDSKAPAEGLLVCDAGEWRALVAGIRAGKFDL